MREAREPPVRPLPPEEQIARNRVLTYLLVIVFIIHAGISVPLVAWFTKSWLAVAALLGFFVVSVVGGAAWFDLVLLRAVGHLGSESRLPRVAFSVCHASRAPDAGSSDCAVVSWGSTPRSTRSAEEAFSRCYAMLA